MQIDFSKERGYHFIKIVIYYWEHVVILLFLLCTTFLHISSSSLIQYTKQENFIGFLPYDSFCLPPYYANHQLTSSYTSFCKKNMPRFCKENTQSLLEERESYVSCFRQDQEWFNVLCQTFSENENGFFVIQAHVNYPCTASAGGTSRKGNTIVQFLKHIMDINESLHVENKDEESTKPFSARCWFSATPDCMVSSSDGMHKERNLFTLFLVNGVPIPPALQREYQKVYKASSCKEYSNNMSELFSFFKEDKSQLLQFILTERNSPDLLQLFLMTYGAQEFNHLLNNQKQLSSILATLIKKGYIRLLNTLSQHIVTRCNTVLRKRKEKRFITLSHLEVPFFVLNREAQLLLIYFEIISSITLDTRYIRKVGGWERDNVLRQYASFSIEELRHNRYSPYTDENVINTLSSHFAPEVLLKELVQNIRDIKEADWYMLLKRIIIPPVTIYKLPIITSEDRFLKIIATALHDTTIEYLYNFITDGEVKEWIGKTRDAENNTLLHLLFSNYGVYLDKTVALIVQNFPDFISLKNNYGETPLELYLKEYNAVQKSQITKLVMNKFLLPLTKDIFELLRNYEMSQNTRSLIALYKFLEEV